MTAPDPIPLYWWDDKPNFGDALGPWLVELMTGRTTVNVRGAPVVPGQVALATAGSLIQTLDRPGLALWGTGLIGPIGPVRLERLQDRVPSTIHAVRGARTAAQLRKKLAWEVPAVYGDPGLLAPRFYDPQPRPDAAGRVALVLHYSHRPLLEGPMEDVHDVDVRGGPAEVIDQIAAAAVCVSSSLHGLVIAQAYKVPWVWLRIADADLLGGAFKFNDFFTVLEKDRARAVILDPERLTERVVKEIAEFAFLPRLTHSVDALLEAFPYEIATPRH